MTTVLYCLLLLPVCVPLYWFAVPRKWRSLLLFAISVLFVGSFSVKFAFYFLLNIAIVYAAGSSIRRRGKAGARTLKITLFWLIGNLCFFKYANQALDAVFSMGDRLSLFPAIELPEVALPLGISYIIFRLVHYVVESYRNKVPKGTFVELGLYVLFFPTFLAGPVDRFQRFHPQTGEKRCKLSDINYGLFRLVLGILRKFVVADTLAKFIMPVLRAPDGYSRPIVILCAYGLAIRVYMDFSGYTDMAIGVSRLFGYKIMENFNRPFLQKNIAMFWRNWHMSVYSWIRDYFFFPLFAYKASNAKIYLGVFCSMVVFMLWHELSLSWLALGIYHGLGLVVWHVFQETKRKHPAVRKLVDRRSLDPLSIAFTFTFVTFGFLIFSLDVGEIACILRTIFQ